LCRTFVFPFGSRALPFSAIFFLGFHPPLPLFPQNSRVSTLFIFFLPFFSRVPPRFFSPLERTPCISSDRTLSFPKDFQFPPSQRFVLIARVLHSFNPLNGPKRGLFLFRLTARHPPPPCVLLAHTSSFLLFSLDYPFCFFRRPQLSATFPGWQIRFPSLFSFPCASNNVVCFVFVPFFF